MDNVRVGRQIRAWVVATEPKAQFVDGLTVRERQVLNRVLLAKDVGVRDTEAANSLLMKFRRQSRPGSRGTRLIELFNRVFRPHISIRTTVRALDSFRDQQRDAAAPEQLREAVHLLRDKNVTDALGWLAKLQEEVQPQDHELLVAHFEHASRVVPQEAGGLHARIAAKLLRVGVPPQSLSACLGPNYEECRLLAESRVLDRMSFMGETLRLDDHGRPLLNAQLSINPAGLRPTAKEIGDFRLYHMAESVSDETWVYTLNDAGQITTVDVDPYEVDDEVLIAHFVLERLRQEIPEADKATFPAEILTAPNRALVIQGRDLTVEQLVAQGIFIHGPAQIVDGWARFDAELKVPAHIDPDDLDILLERLEAVEHILPGGKVPEDVAGTTIPLKGATVPQLEALGIIEFSRNLEGSDIPVFNANVKFEPVSPLELEQLWDEIGTTSRHRQVDLLTVDKYGNIVSERVPLEDVTDETLSSHALFKKLKTLGPHLPEGGVGHLVFSGQRAVTLRLRDLTCEQLLQYKVLQGSGAVNETNHQYVQGGFVQHDRFNWTEMRPYMTLPEGQRPAEYTVDIVTSFARSHGPSAAAGHSFVRMTTPAGEVYSVGLVRGEELGATATDEVWLETPDIHTFMPTHAYQQFVARYELGEDGFKSLMKRIHERQQDFRLRNFTNPTYQEFSNNCTAFAQEIRDHVREVEGVRVATPPEYAHLLPFEAIALRIKAVAMAAIIRLVAVSAVSFKFLRKLSIRGLHLSQLFEGAAGVGSRSSVGSVAEQVQNQSFKINLPARHVPVKSVLRRRLTLTLSRQSQ